MTPLCIMKELSSYCPNGIFWSIYALLHLYEVAQRDAFALHIVISHTLEGNSCAAYLVPWYSIPEYFHSM
jgi:hypothetical protein